MSKNMGSSNSLIDSLEECTNNLKALSTQMSSLYDAIKLTKNSEEREQILYAYKQTFDALSNHVDSFNGLIRVVREQVQDADEPQEQE